MVETDILIVGAGMAGIMAARELQAGGKRVLLIDKGRSAGGRMATRRIGGGLADHGAQFFTVRDPRFKAHVDTWIAAGWVYEWSQGWSDGSHDKMLSGVGDGHPRYAVREGMNALPKRLAESLDIQVDVQVSAIRAGENGWQVEAGERIFRASALILTPPVPQSLKLLDTGGVSIPDAMRAILGNIVYEPCIAVMFILDGEIALPEPGALQRPNAPISWIADNQAKGISPTRVFTAQANGATSRALYESDDNAVIEYFLGEMQELMNADRAITEAQVKRWRYSMPTTTTPERCVSLPTPNGALIFAGDAFGGPRVEGATLSGLAAADVLLGRN